MEKKIMLKKVEREIMRCTRCNLYKTKTNYVPGEGNAGAKVMFIGEAPGYWEDKEGRPFVGRAGKILDELLESVGLRREDVFVTNIVKCRPPGNRDPSEEEKNACKVYLEKQVNIIKPKLIVCLGRHSMKFIFEKFGLRYEPITESHGKLFRVKNLFFDLRVLPLFHPAVALYNPGMKEILKTDFKKIKDILHGI